MKKLIALFLAVVCVLGLVGCNSKTVNIDLPFEVGDVENIEMYHLLEHLCQQKRRSLLPKKP